MKTWIGFLRSYVIYLGNPLKRAKLKKFYANWLIPGDLCFDIGAHMGIQAQILSSMGMQCIAVEPNPRLYQFLQRRFRKDSRIQLLPQAISNQSGEETFHISSIAPTVSTLSDHKFRSALRENSSFNVQWDKQITVETTTLDQLIEAYGIPKLIKLDIEDYEFQALQGLHYPVELITFEFFSYRLEQAQRCMQEVEKNGTYLYNYSIAENFTLQLEQWKSRNEMCEWIRDRSPDDRHGDIIARYIGKK